MRTSLNAFAQTEGKSLDTIALQVIAPPAFAKLLQEATHTQRPAVSSHANGARQHIGISSMAAVPKRCQSMLCHLRRLIASTRQQSVDDAGAEQLRHDRIGHAFAGQHASHGHARLLPLGRSGAVELHTTHAGYRIVPLCSKPARTYALHHRRKLWGGLGVCAITRRATGTPSLLLTTASARHFAHGDGDTRKGVSVVQVDTTVPVS